MQNEPVVIERSYNAPIEMVWNAITNRDEMKKWYFDLAEFKPEMGFEFSFKAGSETKKYMHLCKVTELVPGRKITYSWRYDGYEGISHVTWELFPEGENTKLILTHRGLETFKEGGDFARESFMGGWTYFTQQLNNYLANKASNSDKQ